MEVGKDPVENAPAGATPRYGRMQQPMTLSRAAWIVVTGICAIASLLLLVNGYDGYSAVLAFVGLAAAVNLLP